MSVLRNTTNGNSSVRKTKQNKLIHLSKFSACGQKKIKELYWLYSGWVFSGLLTNGQKGHHLQNLSHISYKDEPWQSYTLPKADPKNIWNRLHTSWVLLTSKIRKFLYIKEYTYRLHFNTYFLIFLALLESGKVTT